MRTNGEDISLTVGGTTVKIGTADAIIATKGEGRSIFRLWFKPYWPGLLHAMALITEARKKARQKS